MPSVFTHVVVGAAMTARAPRAVGRVKLAALLAAVSVLPDLDVVGFSLGIPYSHPLGHRGLTHGIPFAVGLAGLAWWWLRRSLPDDPDAAWRIAALIGLACASHGILDAFTDGGLGIGFAVPFSDQRFFFPFRPILTSPVEPQHFFGPRGRQVIANEMLWIWAPVALAWLLARRRPERAA